MKLPKMLNVRRKEFEAMLAEAEARSVEEAKERGARATGSGRDEIRRIEMTVNLGESSFHPLVARERRKTVERGPAAGPAHDLPPMIERVPGEVREQTAG